MFSRNYLFVVLFIGVALWSAYMLFPAYIEHRKTTAQLREVEDNLLARQQESEELRREVTELKTSPEAVERVAREKFGWCRPEEKVYDFSPPPTPLPPISQ